MNAKFSNIGLAIWILLVVPAGFAESFSGRPTETNMDDLMALGIATGHGVYERCYATQYQTNPVTYYVSPPTFIGTNGWYLSTSVMQSLDSKAKTLVQWYANTNTVYDGTTNITMLSVTSLWAQLVIGDHTNQFTGMPAMGTNPPTYGDYPWWVYSESLEERYKVLNALKMTITLLNFGNMQGRGLANSATYAQALSCFLNSLWTNSPYLYSPGAFCDDTDEWTVYRERAQADISGISTSIPINRFSLITRALIVNGVFWAEDMLNGANPTNYGIITNSINPAPPYTYINIGESDDPVPNFGSGNYGWKLVDSRLSITWNFQYCTNKYW